MATHTLRVPRFRPQGVGSWGFESLGMHWFLFVLLVFALTVTHATSVLAADEKEVLMKMNRSRSAAPDRPNRFLRSLATTAWTIGTSAVAGALSA